MQDRMDSGQGGCRAWDAKQEGFKTGGRQERRVQDMRDAEQERCCKRGRGAGMQEKREEGKEGSG